MSFTSISFVSFFFGEARRGGGLHLRDAAVLERVAQSKRRFTRSRYNFTDTLFLLFLLSFSGDFTLYDHVLDFNYTFNIIPSRFADAKVSDLDRYFAMGRGRQVGGVDLEAQEMQKWFDSN